jgi:hypothetical protein
MGIPRRKESCCGGFEGTDLGVDVSPQGLVATAQKRLSRVVCLSALLTVTPPAMKITIEAFRAAGSASKSRSLRPERQLHKALPDRLARIGIAIALPRLIWLAVR